MRGIASVLLGGFLGYLVDALLTALASTLPGRARETYVEAMVLLAHPMARALSFASGWPLQAEAAMFLYAIAIPATFVLVGMIGGRVVPRWRW